MYHTVAICGGSLLRLTVSDATSHTLNFLLQELDAVD